ncbi:MAG: hypothetical protein WBM34_04825 [Woeseiaceae bacterium]
MPLSPYVRIARGKVVVRVLAGPPLSGNVFVRHGMPLAQYVRFMPIKVVVRVLAGPPLPSGR